MSRETASTPGAAKANRRKNYSCAPNGTRSLLSSERCHFVFIEHGRSIRIDIKTATTRPSFFNGTTISLRDRESQCDGPGKRCNRDHHRFALVGTLAVTPRPLEDLHSTEP
jgi:hypothetical protein